MKKIICLVVAMIALFACVNTSDFQPMVLRYAIHYPDGMVIKEHHFRGNDKAHAKVLVHTHWSTRYEKLFLWYGIDALVDETVVESTAPLEIISIYPEKDERLQDK